jgi:hypothetical protein
MAVIMIVGMIMIVVMTVTVRVIMVIMVLFCIPGAAYFYRICS